MSWSKPARILVRLCGGGGGLSLESDTQTTMFSRLVQGGGPVVTAGMLSSEIAEDLVPGIRVVYLIKKSLSRKRANRLTPEERQELDSYRDSLLPAQFRELREVAQRKRMFVCVACMRLFGALWVWGGVLCCWLYKP